MTSWINCIAGGKVGVYNGGTAVYDSYGENEQVRYLGVQKSTDPINADNITYMIGSSSGGSGGGDDVEPTLRILFIGNSFTKDAVEHLPKMVSAADIPTLKMVHLYYGGRTIPEYADGYLLLGLLQREKGLKQESIEKLKKAQALGDTRPEEYLKQ